MIVLDHGSTNKHICLWCRHEGGHYAWCHSDAEANFLKRPYMCKCGATEPGQCDKSDEECDGMWGPVQEPS